MTKRAVVLAGGWAHPPDDLVDAASFWVAPRGYRVVPVINPSLMVAAIDGGCDLLIVGACWFSMHDDRYSDIQRAEHAVALDSEMRSALTDLKSEGCPLLALHTAVICFDNEQWWHDWLGGSWNWSTSWHPEPQPMHVRQAPASPITFDNFTVTDELYQQVSVDQHVEPVAHSANDDVLVWAHETTQGRAAVNLLGHDHRSLRDPAHVALNGHLIDWLLDS